MSSFAAKLFLAILSLGFAAARADVPDTLSADLKDRDFYQELSQLGERQIEELRRYRQETHGLPPAERLRRRRVLMVAQRREMAQLEAKWRDRINPDQRRRWLERRQDRKRRLETLQHQKIERARPRKAPPTDTTLPPAPVPATPPN
jgi:hypothetical protein